MTRQTPRRTIEKWISRAGFVAGLVVVAGALLAWRVPGGDGTLGADVIFAANPSGELVISPTGPFITAAGLEPSDEREATLRVKNQTGSMLALRPRAVADTRDLDRILRVEVTGGPDVLFSGPLGRLAHGTSRPLRLEPGETRPLSVRIWLPTSTQTGYQGRIASVHMDFRRGPGAT
jgi:hypothetical protein